MSKRVILKGQDIATEEYVAEEISKAQIPQADLSNYLSKTNTTAYTPTGDYNPATKKYVDDNINNKIDKNIIQIIRNSNESISFPSGYTLLPFASTAYSKGNKLTRVDGKVKIGAGVNKVKISGAVNFYNAYQSTGIEVKLNDTRAFLVWNYMSSTGYDDTQVIPDMYIDVQENDLISVYIYKASARSFNIQQGTNIIVEVIE